MLCGLTTWPDGLLFMFRIPLGKVRHLTVCVTLPSSLGVGIITATVVLTIH